MEYLLAENQVRKPLTGLTAQGVSKCLPGRGSPLYEPVWRLGIISKKLFTQTAKYSKSIAREQSTPFERTLRPRFARVRQLIAGLLEAISLEFVACLWTL